MQKSHNLRLKHISLAVATAVLLSALGLYSYSTDRLQIAGDAFFVYLSFFWLVNLFLISLIASGYSERFVDNSLSLVQMYWAFSSSLVFLSISHPFSEPYFFVLLIIIVFGVFRVSPDKFNAFCLYAICVFGCQKIWAYYYLEPSPSPIDIAVQWITFAFCTYVLTALCKSISYLRSRLKKQNINLKEALETKDMFLTNMSHEIRTPINGVVGMLTVLNKSPLNNEQQHYLKLAQTSANSLSGVVNNILDFSMANSGQLSANHVDFDVQEMLASTVESLSFEAQEKGLELILDTSELTHHTIHTDPVHLRQIIVNVLNNAIKFTLQGEILVRAGLKEEADHSLSFYCAIRDTGIGIPQEKLPIIFEAFSQADTTSTRKFGGTGIGLSIAKSLCDLLHGLISVKNNDDRGTCFHIEVPNVASKKLTESSPLLSAATGEIQSLPIAIICKNPTCGITIRKQLSLWGGNAFYFPSLEILEQALGTKGALPQSFRIVIGDDVASLMTCKDLMAEHQHLEYPPRFVFLATQEQASMFTHEENMPISTTLTKPVTFHSLAQAMNTAIHDNSPTKHEFAPDDEQSTQIKANILVVEDNPVNQEVIDGLLEDFEPNRSFANNGAEAIQILLESDDIYTLVLMDCQMPVMDGYEATRAIRAGEAGESYQRIPIIAITAHAMKGDREKCMQAGMNDYLTKPIDLDEFDEKVQQWLGSDEAKDVEERKTQEKPIWNREFALNRAGKQQERLEQLVKLYLSAIPEALDEIKIALQETHPQESQSLAQGLTTLAQSLGAEKMTLKLRQLEALCQVGDLDQAYDLFDQCYECHVELAVQLKTYVESQALSHA